jgi:hypothetical protein
MDADTFNQTLLGLAAWLRQACPPTIAEIWRLAATAATNAAGRSADPMWIDYTSEPTDHHHEARKDAAHDHHPATS